MDMFRSPRSLKAEERFTSISLKLAVITSAVVLAVGTGAATDLNNIETITPSGTNPITITGEVEMSGSNINMNGNAITNYFGSSCNAGQVVVNINDDGTVDCVDATGEVQDDFVDRDGDTMTGSLDMDGNALLNIDWANSDNPNTDNQQLSISGDTISLESGGQVTIQDDTIADNQNLGYSNDNAPTGSYATHTVTIDSGNGATIRDYYDPDTTIADDQQLSISGHTISLDNGGSVTVPDNYEANTDASTECSGNDYLAGDGTCNVDSYEADTTIADNQNLQDVVGRGNSIGSGQTIDASAGAFRLPVGADAY